MVPARLFRTCFRALKGLLCLAHRSCEIAQKRMKPETDPWRPRVMGVSRRTLPLAAAVLLTASGTACSSTHHNSPPRGSAAPAPAMRLVAYDTCQALLS